MNYFPLVLHTKKLDIYTFETETMCVIKDYFMDGLLKNMLCKYKCEFCNHWKGYHCMSDLFLCNSS